MADFITLLSAVWAVEFAVSPTLSMSLGQLVIFSTIFGTGVSFYHSLKRG